MTVECKYAVLVTAIGSKGLEYSFPLYANLQQRADFLAGAMRLAARTGSPIVVDNVPVVILRCSDPYTL